MRYLFALLLGLLAFASVAVAQPGATPATQNRWYNILRENGNFGFAGLDTAEWSRQGQADFGQTDIRPWLGLRLGISPSNLPFYTYDGRESLQADPSYQEDQVYSGTLNGSLTQNKTYSLDVFFLFSPPLKRNERDFFKRRKRKGDKGKDSASEEGGAPQASVEPSEFYYDWSDRTACRKITAPLAASLGFAYTDLTREYEAEGLFGFADVTGLERLRRLELRGSAFFFPLALTQNGKAFRTQPYLRAGAAYLVSLPYQAERKLETQVRGEEVQATVEDLTVNRENGYDGFFGLGVNRYFSRTTGVFFEATLHMSLARQGLESGEGDFEDGGEPFAQAVDFAYLNDPVSVHHLSFNFGLIWHPVLRGRFSGRPRNLWF